MPDNPDDKLLGLIEDALAAGAVWTRLPGGLARSYAAYLDRLYRQTNRVALAIFTVVFDLFLCSQAIASPELVPLSATLRLAVYTPAVLIFLALDLRAVRLPRLQYDTYLLALAALPGIVSAIICVHTTSTHSLSDVHATTLILLAVCMIVRQRLIAVYLTVVISFTAFLVGLLLTPVIPRSELPSLLLTDLAIAATVTVFSIVVDRRDRQVFLLNLREQVRAQGLTVQNQGLRHQVDLDALTGLANRGCFDTTLASVWLQAQLGGTPVGLMMIDVDHFKAFNDHYGHQAGDDCLRRIAQQARPAIRISDLLARYGGEEFAVILPGATLAVTCNIAERVRASVAAMAIPHEGAGPGCLMSISVGVASVTPGAASQAAGLVEAADRCLYAAKDAGRNRVSATDA